VVPARGRTSPYVKILMKNLMRSAPAEIHNAKQRMPAILHSEDIGAWLAGSADDARAALQPYPADSIVAWPISSKVNSPKNNERALLEKIWAFGHSSLTSAQIRASPHGGEYSRRTRRIQRYRARARMASGNPTIPASISSPTST